MAWGEEAPPKSLSFCQMAAKLRDRYEGGLSPW